MLKVEHSAMMRGESFALAISFAVAISASGFGRLVMMMGAAVATALASRAIATPALDNSLRLFAATSKPVTRQPAATRLRENAPPMMPSPITPTVLLLFAGLIPNAPWFSARRTLAHDSKRWEPVSGKGHFVTGPDRLSSTATLWFSGGQHARQSCNVRLCNCRGRNDFADDVVGIRARLDQQKALVGRASDGSGDGGS